MKKRELCNLIIPIALFYVLLESIGITCPIKYITGVSCAGCGMSRALLSLLRLDFKQAFHYHPLFLFPFIAFTIYVFKNKFSKKTYNSLFMIIIFIMLAVYFIRMFNPNDDVVVFEPMNGILFRMLQLK